MLTVHRPPIYGYEPTTSVGVRFKVFCQNYEHLRGEWRSACTELGGRSTLERGRHLLHPAPLIYLSLFG